MKYLVLVLDENLSRVDRAVLCSDASQLVSVGRPPASPATPPQLSPAAASPVPFSPAGARSPPPLSPVLPSPPPPSPVSPGWASPSTPPLVCPEAEWLLAEYREELRALAAATADGGAPSCPLRRLASETEAAVELLFPELLLREAESGDRRDIFGSPPLSPADWPDLSCYDPETGETARGSSSSASASPRGSPAASVFSLDCPEEPGRDCESCSHHRRATGVAGALCSLCYMRQTFHCIYSPVSEEEL
ncbi:E1A [Ovine adenovirus 8]|uniref:E1A n=1 Tax=Ovine adenovirus 8 TaxID=2601527 RepID=A0A5B8MBJ6_9ADEN|nr:E1A [Ovine adenovirus 8]QDZ17454.1 E1A [Ovine adenovirus 8]